MREHEIKLATTDGLGLYAQEWLPDEAPLGVVCVLHGLGEHGGQYVGVAKALVDRAVALIAIDLRGHGRSGGRRGHTPSYGALLDDVDALLAGTAQRHPDVPMFLYGHSLGGNIVLNHALRRQPGVAGIVATSPWLRLTNDIAWWKRVVATVVEPFWPTLSFTTGTNRDELLNELGLRRNAELFHNLISVRLLMQARRAGLWAVRHSERLSAPTLLLHGEADQVTAPAGSLEFSRKAGGLCEVRFRPGVGHCIHEEDPSTIPTVVEWIVRRLGND